MRKVPWLFLKFVQDWAQISVVYNSAVATRHMSTTTCEPDSWPCIANARLGPGTEGMLELLVHTMFAVYHQIHGMHFDRATQVECIDSNVWLA